MDAEPEAPVEAANDPSNRDHRAAPAAVDGVATGGAAEPRPTDSAAEGDAPPVEAVAPPEETLESPPSAVEDSLSAPETTEELAPVPASDPEAVLAWMRDVATDAAYAPPVSEAGPQRAAQVASARARAGRCDDVITPSDEARLDVHLSDGGSVALEGGGARWRLPGLRASRWRTRGNVAGPIRVDVRDTPIHFRGTVELEDLAILDVEALPHSRVLAALSLIRAERRGSRIVARAMLSDSLFLDVARECGALAPRRDAPAATPAIETGHMHRIGASTLWVEGEGDAQIGEIFSAELPRAWVAVVEAFETHGERTRVRIPTMEGPLHGWVSTLSLGAEIPRPPGPLPQYARSVFVEDPEAAEADVDGLIRPRRGAGTIGLGRFGTIGHGGPPAIRRIPRARLARGTPVYAQGSGRLLARTRAETIARLISRAGGRADEFSIVSMGPIVDSDGALYVRERDFEALEPPRLRVHFSEAEVRSGAIDPSIVRRILRRHQNELRHCRESLGDPRDTQTVEITVRWVVAADGAITTAMPTRSTSRRSAIDHCIVRAFRRWRFPPTEEPGVRLLEVTIRFAWE